ncbi:hypothetical protein SeseC_00705 [Streptococcus equi subsp. zooepidemicus ATCC 35246]|nr:hypothetical protein SeseC_00705 [Streptococcus equi subsp. zooepidemicus ATCC 35246]
MLSNGVLSLLAVKKDIAPLFTLFLNHLSLVLTAPFGASDPYSLSFSEL